MAGYSPLRFWLAALAAAALARAEEAASAAVPVPPTAAPATDPAASPIVSNPGTAAPARPELPAAPRRHRVISSDVAAQLSAAVPKYTPPPPKPPPSDDDEAPDLRDIDKPRNGIIRLPKYVVHERPPPVLTERAVNTDKGLADLAMRRYLTEGYRALNGFTLPLFGKSSEAMAMMMYREDERLKNMADLNEAARMVSATDRSAGLYVKKQVEATYNRPGDFDWKPIGR